MSQVMGFGFPQGEMLRCDHPSCTELAGNIGFVRVPGGEEAKPREIYGCDAHFEQMRASQLCYKQVKLRKPGERNS